MSKKLTTTEFIEIAKKLHSNIYDYSESDYINGLTRINIICTHHGRFEQISRNHLQGQG